MNRDASHHLTSLTGFAPFCTCRIHAHETLQAFLLKKTVSPLVSMQIEWLEMAGVAPVAPVGEGESLFGFRT
jgi:hypothetical protein